MAKVAPTMNWVICMLVKVRFMTLGILIEKADRV
jgi:hypothetical protein